MRLVYNIGIYVYVVAVFFAAIFKPKAREWLAGRKNWRKKYKKKFDLLKDQKTIWFHCASLGEFEMARPVIERLRTSQQNNINIVVSFFSPSGYTIQKNYALADAVIYLPIDTPSNANAFIQLIKPSIAVFVKYEIWVNYFQALKKDNVKVVLMNAVFRKEHRFFKWYGALFREALQTASKVFVQDMASQKLLETIQIGSEVSGDTRYDRVMQIKEQPKQVDDVKQWVNNRFCVVCGSSWQPEEDVVSKILTKAPQNIAWIVVPHDVSTPHIDQIQKKFGDSAILLSKLSGNDYGKPVMIVDSVGKLAQLYSIANIAIVGGGFSGKLHNILEAGVYGIPVLFGPNYHRFHEAVEMVEAKAAISFFDDEDIILYLEWFYYDHVMVDKVKVTQHFIFEKNRGAVIKVSDYLLKGI